MPFAVHIPKEERDLNLDVRLRAELTGILTWAVQGCLAWQAQGLAEPAEVMRGHTRVPGGARCHPTLPR